MFINIKMQIKLPVFTNSKQLVLQLPNSTLSSNQLLYLIMHSPPLSTIHTSSSSETGSPNSVHRITAPPPDTLPSSFTLLFLISSAIWITPRCSLYPHHLSTLHANKLPGHSAAASKSSLASLDRSHCPFTLQCVYVWLRYLSPHPPTYRSQLSGNFPCIHKPLNHPPTRRLSNLTRN